MKKRIIFDVVFATGFLTVSTAAQIVSSPAQRSHHYRSGDVIDEYVSLKTAEYFDAREPGEDADARRKAVEARRKHEERGLERLRVDLKRF